VAVALKGSWAAKSGAAPVIPPRPGDYPPSATCKICGGRITFRHVMQLEWRHEVAATAAPPAPSEDAA
jgi:hypothetical protein